MIWEFYQMQQIGKAQASAENSARRSESVVSNIDRLNARLDKLTLINMAMWSLLQEVSDLTEEDLTERIKQIDLSDGSLDGKVRAKAQRCPQCNRVMSSRHSRCLYCGYEGQGDFGAFGEALD
ncbi:MAG: hypothetical protein P9L94_17085 [Candidatus Hinthialibacter antarcticus]|nr:hypothetical protein [Candidatus Hinthialibacter antarcticus]